MMRKLTSLSRRSLSHSLPLLISALTIIVLTLLSGIFFIFVSFPVSATPLTNTVTATINVGLKPRGVAYDPVNHDVYVADSNDGGRGSISVIDSSTNTVISTICGTAPCSAGDETVGRLLGPSGVAFDPSNNYIYVTGNTIYSPYAATNAVLVIDGSTNTVVTTILGIGTGCCAYNPGDISNVAYNQANGNMYVSTGCCYSGAPSPSVSVISSTTNTVQDTINMAAPPTGLAYDPVNQDMYVGLNPTEVGGLGSVAVIDSSSNTVVDTIGGFGIGFGVGNLAFDEANNNVYVTSGGGWVVQTISGSTNSILATINTRGADSGGGSGISYNPANQQIYVTNRASEHNTVEVIDSFTNDIVDTITAGFGPTGIAYNSQNNAMYVANNADNTVSVISTSVPGCAAPPSGLVSWWPGDESFNDIVDGNPGVTINGATFDPGKVGGALSFDGIDDGVEIPNSVNGNLDITGTQITIDAWVFPRSIDQPLNPFDGMTVIDKYWNGAPDGYILQLSNGKPAFGLATTDLLEAGVIAPDALAVNVWSHVAGTYNGTTVSIYVDGILTASRSATGNILHDNLDLMIGNDNGGRAMTYGMNGLIDEVHIFDRSLTASEVQSIFLAGSAGNCKPSAVLVDDFDDNTINPSLWAVIVTGTGPTISATNQRLEINLPANSTDDTTPSDPSFVAGIESTCLLRGDFDVQVDFQLLTWPFASGVRVGLGATGVGSTERVSLGAPADVPGQPREVYVTHFSDGLQGFIPTSDLSGKLRTVRSGSSVTGYYFSSGSWVPIHTAPAPTTDVEFSIASWSHDYYAFTDQDVKDAFDNFTVNEGELICPPILQPIQDKSVDEETLLSFTVTAGEADPQQTITLTADVLPQGATFTSAAASGTVTGTFTWTPSEAQGPGTYTITFAATDARVPAPSTASETITITVNEVNLHPSLDVPDSQTVDEGSLLIFTLSANDPDMPANTVTLACTNCAALGATFNAATGQFSWTPTETQGPSDYPFTFTATDNGSPSLSDRGVVSVHVNEVNISPALTVPEPQAVNERELLSFTVSATDPDIPANTVTLSASTLPTGATFSALTGLYSWTPSEAQGPADLTIAFTADDGHGGVTTRTVIIHVNEVNQRPVLGSIGDRSVNEGTLLTFTATATDPDLPANTLTFSLGADAPTGATITPGGVFTWRPTEGHGPGTYMVTIRVTDNGSPSMLDSETINITVAEVNSAPVLGHIGDKTATAGSLLTFTASATDPDIPAQALIFTLGSAPTGTFPNGATMTSGGMFSWTPTSAQAPGTFTARITVSDGSLTDFEDITITVASQVSSVDVKCKNTTCTVQSNSTITDAKITGNKIRFTATGPTGTKGYANVTIPKTAVPNIDRLKVKVNDSEIPRSSLTITMNATSYFVYFTFTFQSPAIIDIELEPATTGILGLEPPIFYGTAGALVAVAATSIILLRKRRHRLLQRQQPPNSKRQR